MKIGILTLPLHSNYGGILQAYALQLYLKRRGHEVTLIDRQFNGGRFKWIKDILKILIFRKKLKAEKEKNIIKQHIDYFIDNYIEPKSTAVYSYKELRQIIKKNKFNAVVVGSDQVWRYRYIQTMWEDYFLRLNNGYQFKKLSYAASFGTDIWEGDKEIVNKIKPLINDFDGISVREQSGVNLCKNLFQVDVEQHIDPVALLDLSDYKKLVNSENEPEREEDLLVYMLDIGHDKQKVVDRIQTSIGGKTFSINKPQVNEDAPLEEKIYPTVTNWLKGFFDAKFVITDSFHGTIFSLMHNKPFIVYGNRKRGLTRFYSLLENVGLSNRIIQKAEELTDDMIYEKIDWERVNNFLNNEQNRTDNYFRKFGL